MCEGAEPLRCPPDAARQHEHHRRGCPLGTQAHCRPDEGREDQVREMDQGGVQKIAKHNEAQDANDHQ